MDYSSWIKQSFTVAKRAKWLWIPAAIMVSSSSISFRSFDKVFEGLKPSPSTPPQILEQPSDVLGATTNVLMDILQSLSFSAIAFLVLAIVFAAVFGFIVRMILASWSTAAVFLGVREALGGKDVTLLSVSALARPKIKPLIIYGILLGLLMTFCLIGLMICAVGLIAMLGSTFTMGIKILLALLIIIVIIGLAFVFAVTLFVSVYAQRYILFFNVSSWNALRLGSLLLRKNIGPTLFVSLICMVAAIVGGIVAIPLSVIPAGVLGLPLIVPLVQGNQPTITGIVSGVIGGTSGFLLGGTIGIIISAFVVVFQQSLWNLLFDHLTKENT